MKSAVQRIAMCGAAALAAMLCVDALSMGIDGLGAVPVSVGATPQVRDGRLEVPLAEQGALGIAPWPAYLPQRFDAQQVSASRQLHPAGPIDKVVFTREGDNAPWLEVTHGARAGSELVGGWRLLRSRYGWSAAKGSALYRMGNGSQSAPASVPVGRERWCIYLMESRVPQAQGRQALATEEEAQADWVAVRLEGRRTRCPQR